MPERFMRGIEILNGIVWGPMGLGLLFGTGLLLTVRTGGLQLRRWGYWMQHTLGAILTDQSVTAHTAREEQEDFWLTLEPLPAPDPDKSPLPAPHED